MELGWLIPASALPRISSTRVFERFHRVEGTQARTHEGTGIGLALVQELISLHGGKVRVESSVGKGRTFIVTFRSEPRIFRPNGFRPLDHWRRQARRRRVRRGGASGGSRTTGTPRFPNASVVWGRCTCIDLAAGGGP